MDLLWHCVVAFCFCALSGAESPLQISVESTFGGATVQVPENSPPGTFVALVLVDSAQGRVHCTTFHPEHEVTALQMLSPGVYKLMTTSSLDRELVSSFSVQIMCMNDAASSAVSVTVQVLDVNDNAPVFSRREYHMAVKASAPVGTVVGTVQAMDRDMHSEIRYFLRSPQAGVHDDDGDDDDLPLAVDAFSGQLSTRRRLEMEGMGQVEKVIVLAQEACSPGRFTATATVFLAVAPDHGDSARDVVSTSS